MAMQAARKTTDTEQTLVRVGGNGSTAEEGGDHRGHPISKQGAVETRIMNEIPAAYVSGRRHIGYVLPDGNQCQRSCHEGRFHIGPGQAELWQRQYRTGDGFRDGGRGDDAQYERGRIAGDQGQHYGNYRKNAAETGGSQNSDQQCDCGYGNPF